jgi:hypothetical protein
VQRFESQQYLTTIFQESVSIFLFHLILSYVEETALMANTSPLTLKVWRLRVGATTADDYIRRGPNRLQKTQL